MNRLFTLESFSKNIRVLLTRAGLSLGKEIEIKLKELKQFEIVSCQNPSPDLLNLEPFDIVIHLAGFDPPSFAETLYHTSILHQLLDLCLKHKAKFILVIPSQNTALKEVAISLVRQFHKLFAVSFEIVEVEEKDLISNTADEVLNKFIHHSQFQKLKKDIPSQSIPKQEKKIAVQLPNISKRIMGILLMIILLLGSGIGLKYLQLFTLKCGIDSLQKGLWQQSRQCAQVTKYLMAQSAVPQLLIDLSRVGESGQQLLTGKSEDINNISGQLSYAQERLAETQLEVKDEKTKNLLGVWRAQIKRFRSVVEDLPKALGSGKSTEYLVLIQDKWELRPTGGFIDGLALVTVMGGKIDSVQLMTTYTADGQLKGTVVPPDDLKLALNESSWFLRDSNWNPSFSESARQAAWFVQKQLGKMPDIVVGLHTGTMAKLLAVTGPVYIEGISQKIDAKNLLDIGLANSSPDLTKRSIYLNVFQAILAKTQTLPSSDLGILGTILIDELENRQLFISGIGESAGWNGGLLPKTCPGVATCIADTIYLVSSNTGINKVNAKVSQNVTVDISFRDTVADVSLNTSITNKSNGNAWPLGNYKNYLRFYLPASAKVSQVVINNKPIATTDYNVKQTREFVIVGVMVNIDSGQTVPIGLNFSRNLPTQNRFTYSLDIPNQPGVDSGFVSVAVRFPPTWLAQANLQPQVAAAGLFRYNSLINKPFRIDIDLLRHD